MNRSVGAQAGRPGSGKVWRNHGRSEPWQAPEGSFEALRPALKGKTAMDGSLGLLWTWDLGRREQAGPTVLLTGFSYSGEGSVSISSPFS